MRDARQRGRLQPEMNGQRQFPHRFPRMRPHNGSADNPPVPIKRNARQALRPPLRHGAVHVSVLMVRCLFVERPTAATSGSVNVTLGFTAGMVLIRPTTALAAATLA